MLGMNDSIKKHIYQYCIMLLSRKEYSLYTIQTKIIQKFKQADELLIQEVLDLLIEQNILDNQRYTQSLIRYYFKKGESIRSLQYRLKQEEISIKNHEILEIIHANFPLENCIIEGDDIIDKQVLESCLSKKKKKEQFISYMMRKGHSYYAINKYLSLKQYA